MKDFENQISSSTKKEATSSTPAPDIDPSALPLLQKSSFFFFLIVSFFIVLNIVLVTLKPDQPPLHHYSPEFLIIEGLFSLGFLIASISRSLSWLGPIMLLAFLPFHLSSHIASMYSLGAFLIAIIELYRIGFFKRAGLFKIATLFIYYALTVLLVGIARSVFVVEIIMPIIFLFLFFLYLLPLFQGKWQINILRPRQKIRYKDLNLSERETDFLKQCLDGATFKEIASRNHVSESTVRNTFAHIYHKFEVTGRRGLLSKFADFDIID